MTADPLKDVLDLAETLLEQGDEAKALEITGLALDQLEARLAARDIAPHRRDATAGELKREPDIILQDLAQGLLGATTQTARLARQELDARRLRR